MTDRLYDSFTQRMGPKGADMAYRASSANLEANNFKVGTRSAAEASLLPKVWAIGPIAYSLYIPPTTIMRVSKLPDFEANKVLGLNGLPPGDGSNPVLDAFKEVGKEYSRFSETATRHLDFELPLDLAKMIAFGGALVATQHLQLDPQIPSVIRDHLEAFMQAPAINSVVMFGMKQGLGRHSYENEPENYIERGDREIRNQAIAATWWGLAPFFGQFVAELGNSIASWNPNKVNSGDIVASVLGSGLSIGIFRTFEALRAQNLIEDLKEVKD